MGQIPTLGVGGVLASCGATRGVICASPGLVFASLHAASTGGRQFSCVKLPSWFPPYQDIKMAVHACLVVNAVSCVL